MSILVKQDTSIYLVSMLLGAIMSACGRGTITTLPTPIPIIRGSASPMDQSRRIAFVSERDDNSEIYVMNDDGSGRIQLTNHPAYEGEAAWSTDGSQIVFQSERDGNQEIYIMDADGTGMSSLTDIPARDRTPAW